MQRITVNAQSRSYAVLCGHGLLSQLGVAAEALGEHTGAFAISSTRIWRKWGKALQQGFGVGGCKPILFDDREKSKKLATVERICRDLVKAGADRRALIVALGGGVVGDVAGFVAASFMRGVMLLQAPTTLVAQVDSAIGGKTGVNLPEGKNLVGAFYQPSLVVADPETLRTLPPRQYRSGLYEVIKYGVISDAQLFEFLETSMPQLLRRHGDPLDWVIQRSVAAKAAVVSQDERENRRREILNFGHTVGHALEAVTRYQHFLHGEAVGWGMLAAARLAEKAGMLPVTLAARLERLVRSVGPLPPLPRVTVERLIETMHHDKKARGGVLRFVLPRRIGAADIGVELPEVRVRKILSEWLTSRGAS